MSRTYNANWSLGGEPNWLPLALLLATLSLEAIDLYRSTPHREAWRITPEDCWALCAWSDRPVGSWSEQQCVCAERRP
jgi:hypothetical protein